MKKYILAVVAICFFTLAQCTIDKPLPSGYETLQRANKGEVVVTEVKANRSAAFWKTPVAGSRGTLLLGANQNVQAYFLLRFTSFSGIDTANVQSAVLTLQQKFHYGDGDSFAVKVYPVSAEWDESTVQWNNIKDSYDAGSVVGEFSVPPADSAVINVNLTPALVNNWISQGSNNGILFVSEQAPFMAEFYSSESSSGWARISIAHRQKSGTLDTTKVEVVYDATLLQYNAEIPENTLQQDVNRLRIGNLTGYRSLLGFDLSQIPMASTIHQAYLILHVDKANSYTRSFGVSFAATVVVADSLWGPTTLKLDSLYTSPTGIAVSDNETFEFTSSEANQLLTARVQSWVLKKQPNYGLMVYSGEMGANAAEMSFYSGIEDTTLAPRLRITYSLPSINRFQAP